MPNISTEEVEKVLKVETAGSGTSDRKISVRQRVPTNRRYPMHHTHESFNQHGLCLGANFHLPHNQ